MTYTYVAVQTIGIAPLQFSWDRLEDPLYRLSLLKERGAMKNDISNLGGARRRDHPIIELLINRQTHLCCSWGYSLRKHEITERI